MDIELLGSMFDEDIIPIQNNHPVVYKNKEQNVYEHNLDYLKENDKYGTEGFAKKVANFFENIKDKFSTIDKLFEKYYTRLENLDPNDIQNTLSSAITLDIRKDELFNRLFLLSEMLDKSSTICVEKAKAKYWEDAYNIPVDKKFDIPDLMDMVRLEQKCFPTLPNIEKKVLEVGYYNINLVDAYYDKILHRTKKSAKQNGFDKVDEFKRMYEKLKELVSDADYGIQAFIQVDIALNKKYLIDDSRPSNLSVKERRALGQMNADRVYFMSCFCLNSTYFIEQDLAIFTKIIKDIVRATEV